MAGYSPVGAQPIPPEVQPLPVQPTEYHQFYRAPAFRWWKPLVALVLFAVGWLGASVVAVMFALAWDAAHSGQGLDPTNLNLNTPAVFAANNVSLAACIPIAMLVSWLVFRQRPRFLSSIAGRFRWRLFWQFFLVAAPLLIVWVGVDVVLSGGPGELSWGPDSLFLLVTILVTTPLQAAGEEYANRGLIARSVGSWFGNRWVALAAATVANSVVFMLLHSAEDPWLNSYYFTVAVVFTLLTWRTGGLEAAIVMHVVNNLLGEFTLPFSPDDLSHLFDRQAGVAGPETLIQIGVTVFVGAMLWWRASRLKLARATDPGAAPALPWQPPTTP
ncbi:MAG: CPBP family intramembrane metalloprotease [Propionibacteriaceae bacterium]|nr:CPBP family intramembrane metalloprotease [Propionibacteriaceae bacterium]